MCKGVAVVRDKEMKLEDDEVLRGLAHTRWSGGRGYLRIFVKTLAGKTITFAVKQISYLQDMHTQETRTFCSQRSTGDSVVCRRKQTTKE